MNYLAWNNLLGEYFFNPANGDKEIFLYSSKAIVIEQFKKSEHFQPFKNELLEDLPEDSPPVIDMETIELAIWDDFCKALRVGFTSANGLKPWFDKMEDCWVQWEGNKSRQVHGFEVRYPTYLTYLTALILPLTEYEDDFSASNYYDRVTSYFLNNHFFITSESRELQANPGSFRNVFSNRFRSLEKCWSGLAAWSARKNGDWGVFKVKIIGGFQHVGKPFAECILTKQQRQLIPLLFEKANLQVNGPLTLDDCQAILAAHGKELLHYPAAKWQSITQNGDLTDLLTRVIKEAYENWKGKVVVISQKDQQLLCSTTVFNLYLSITIDAIQGEISSFKFRFFRPDYTDDYDEYQFIYKSLVVEELDFYNSGWSKQKINLPLETGVVLDQKIIFKDTVNQLKAIHEANDLYVFSSVPSLSDFTNKTTLSYNGSYYLLAKTSVIPAIEEWLVSCEQHGQLDYDGVPGGWRFYYFKNPIKDCPSFKVLSLPLDIRLSKVEGLKLDGNIYLDAFPIRFTISGLRPGEEVTALETGQGIAVTLVKEGNDNYRLDPGAFTIWQKFKIQAGNMEPFSRIFSVQEYSLPGTFSAPELNGLGLLASPGEAVIAVNGLSITSAKEDYNAAWSLYYFNNLAANPGPPLTTHGYQFVDHLLYALSSKSTFGPDYFNNAFLTCHRQLDQEKFSNYYLSRAVDYYHQLGFINHHYNVGQKRYDISVNPPTLLALPMKLLQESWYRVLLTGARTPALMKRLIAYAKENGGIYLDCSGAHEPEMSMKYLLPQIVVLKTRNIEHFKALARTLGIAYQPGIYYPLSLIKHTADIEHCGQYLKGLASFLWKDYEMSKITIDKENLKVVKTTGPIDTTWSFAEYNPGTWQAKSVIWENDLAWEVEKRWGMFYFLYRSGGGQVLSYDKNNERLTVPDDFRLPKILARALCLMSGRAPVETWHGRRLFYVYDLPEKLEWNIMLKKLNQRKHI